MCDFNICYENWMFDFATHTKFLVCNILCSVRWKVDRSKKGEILILHLKNEWTNKRTDEQTNKQTKSEIMNANVELVRLDFLILQNLFQIVCHSRKNVQYTIHLHIVNTLTWVYSKIQDLSSAYNLFISLKLCFLTL